MNKQTVSMVQTNDIETRRAQREYLKGVYPDYDARYHDSFRLRFVREQEAKAFADYCINRGL
jgi:hypothetical protein